jgi:starch-binding outer membrane protein, SusD/RagB family
MFNNRLLRLISLSISRRILGIGFLVLALTLPACDEFLDVGVPRSQLVSASAFEDEGSARSALLAIYAEMMSANQGFASGGSNSLSVLAGLSADEFVDRVHDKLDFQNNSLQATNDIVRSSIWAPAYKYIYYANALLEGLAISTKLKDEVKKPMEGEAKFLRAFIYFYLTNLFGDIPLILTTDYETNNVVGKVSSQEVYAQILADLSDAEQLLPVSFDQDSKYGRARAGRYAAKALLARVYLYQGEWAKAESVSSEVIESGNYDLVDIENVFLAKDNREAIWQLMPAYDGLAPWEALFFYSGSVAMRDDLVGLFDAYDYRTLYWKFAMDPNNDQVPDFSVPFKYKTVDSENPKTSEYSMVLRLAEQYLIRAEARAHLGGILLSKAAEDINAIRDRAYIIPSPIDLNSTQDELFMIIEQERRRELFSEWGHRWFDLKRTGRAHDVLTAAKGTEWQHVNELYPIPASEIVQNPSLGPQNDGY